MTDTGEHEIEQLLSEAQSDSPPWYRQAWFTKIVAPLTVVGVTGVASTFFILRADVWAAKQSAEQANQRAARNQGQIKQLREDQHKIQTEMIDAISGFESELQNNTEAIERLRNDFREHRKSHH